MEIAGGGVVRLCASLDLAGTRAQGSEGAATGAEEGGDLASMAVFSLYVSGRLEDAEDSPE